MSLFRSERMQLCQLFLRAESAYDCIAELGEVGAAQFRDLNPEANPYQRKYINEVRRCDEMERQMRYLESEMDRVGITIHEHFDDPRAPPPREMVDIESRIEKLESDLIAINNNEETLCQNFLELTELKHILTKTQQFFDEVGSAQDGTVRISSALGGSEERINESSSASQRSRGGAARPVKKRLNKQLTLTFGGKKSVVDQGERQPLLENIERLSSTAGEPKTFEPLLFVTGVIDRKRLVSFERLLWRACRGNVYFKWDEIEEELTDPHTREVVHKVVFVVFFQGKHLKTIVKKICDGFHAKVYPCPASSAERREVASGVDRRIQDISTILNETTEHRQRSLTHSAKDLRIWARQVQKMKAIYHTLNLLNIDVTHNTLIGECWIPVSDIELIKNALALGDQDGGAAVPSIINALETDETPPTYFRLNKFTRGYQNIVDAYGIADYTELNPAPWTIVTFPFLFGVMFGDVGHGFIMFLFALAIVVNEKKLAHLQLGDIFDIFFSGRYVVLMMGLFSMYCGFHYNEFFSKSVDLFGFGWHIPQTDSQGQATIFAQGFGNFTGGFTKGQEEKVYFELDPLIAQNHDAIYPMGIDPIWNNLAENKLIFIDSFKMKLSVILGVAQMFFGVVLSLFNHLHFHDTIKVFCEFIPEMIFLSAIFVYMDVLIIAKWLIFWVEPFWMNDTIGWYPGTNCAPSLLIGIINMVMMTEKKVGFGTYNSNADCAHDNRTCIEENFNAYPTNCALQQWYPHQSMVEKLLLVLAVVSIPWILIPRPLIMWRQATAHRPDYQQIASSDDIEDNDDAEEKLNGEVQKTTTPKPGSGGGHDSGEFNVGDAFVYQAIHTIEFALGCVSHTASYLRLWALSLAHSQLSEVLWTMVMNRAFTIGGKLVLPNAAALNCIIFVLFASLTLAILVLMEGLSAFLHSLRLHWVEFQSKFYIGSGYLFTPFNFAKEQMNEQNID